MTHKVDQTTPESIRNHITELKSHLLKSCISIDFLNSVKLVTALSDLFPNKTMLS